MSMNIRGRNLVEITLGDTDMSYQLVISVLNSRFEEIGSGAGRMIRSWTPAEIKLANYADSVLRDRNAINDQYLELQQEYRKLVALADSLKKEVDQLREQLSIAEDDYYGGW